jgi:hypothetical protein
LHQLTTLLAANQKQQFGCLTTMERKTAAHCDGSSAEIRTKFSLQKAAVRIQLPEENGDTAQQLCECKERLFSVVQSGQVVPLCASGCFVCKITPPDFVLKVATSHEVQTALTELLSVVSSYRKSVPT